MAVQALSPDLLDMLAEKLPQLERLEVNFAYLRTSDLPIDISRRDPYLTQEVVNLVSWPFFVRPDASFHIDVVGHQPISSRDEKTIIFEMGIEILRLRTTYTVQQA